MNYIGLNIISIEEVTEIYLSNLLQLDKTPPWGNTTDVLNEFRENVLSKATFYPMAIFGFFTSLIGAVACWAHGNIAAGKGLAIFAALDFITILLTFYNIDLIKILEELWEWEP
jgi:hypothetical protein